MSLPERRRMLPEERAHLESLASTMTGSPVHTLELFIAHSLRVLKLALVAAGCAWVLIRIGWEAVGAPLMFATKWLLVVGLALNAGLSVMLSRMFHAAIGRMRERIDSDLARGEVVATPSRARAALLITRGEGERGDSHVLELEDGRLLYVNAVHTVDQPPGRFPAVEIEVVRAPDWADVVAVHATGAPLPLARTLPALPPGASARLGTVRLLPGPLEAAERLLASPPVETSPTV
jgi:hypothetical protein